MLCLCHGDPALLRFWIQTNLSACYLEIQAGKTFFAKVMRWSRSTSNFYALIGHNLTGEFMPKIYAASWILFTLTAEADRVFCQLVTFLTVFFYKNEIQLLSRVLRYSWLVFLLVFWLRVVNVINVVNVVNVVVSSLYCNINRCGVCFQSFSVNITCTSTQTAARIKRFWRLHIDKITKKINVINSLLCWSETLLIVYNVHSNSRPQLINCKSENRLAV